MCCIFTCCGWVVDLIQRFWAFSMSCCISSAVCCALFTAAMAGIALGYNYSLAEYIDIKETNVSVYLKRGVFDDEIANEMEWRRSGNALPPPETKYRGGNFDITVPTPPSAEQLDFRRKMDDSQDGRRRLDDSILQSDDANKYEGSLMRLTAGVPASVSTITEEIASADPKLLEIADQYPRESLDQLKALQGMVNLRRGNLIPTTTPMRPPEPTFNPDQFKNIPPGILNFLPDTMRRAMQYNELGIIPNYNSANVNPSRKAVPMPMDDRDWRDPKVKDKNYFTNDMAMGVDIHPTYPGPVNLHLRPARPTRPRALAKSRVELVKGGERQREREDVLEKSIDSELGKFKEKLMLDKFDMPRMPEEGMGDKTMKKGDDYDEEIRGLPVRRRRGELPRSRIRRDLGVKIGHEDLIITGNDNYPSTRKIHSVFKTDMKNNYRFKTNKTVSHMFDTVIKTNNHPNIPTLLTSLNLLKNNVAPEGVEAPKNNQNNRMIIIIADNTSYSLNVSSPLTDSENKNNYSHFLNTSENDKNCTTQNTDSYPSFSTLNPGDEYDDHNPTGRYKEKRDILLRTGHTNRFSRLFATVAIFDTTIGNNNYSLDDEMNEVERNEEIDKKHYNQKISLLKSERKEGRLDLNCTRAKYIYDIDDSTSDSNKFDTIVNTITYPSYRTENSRVYNSEYIDNKEEAHNLSKEILHEVNKATPNNSSVINYTLSTTDATPDRYPTCGTVKESNLEVTDHSNANETNQIEEQEEMNIESDTNQNDTSLVTLNIESFLKLLAVGIHF